MSSVRHKMVYIIKMSIHTCKVLPNLKQGDTIIKDGNTYVITNMVQENTIEEDNKGKYKDIMIFTIFLDKIKDESEN